MTRSFFLILLLLSGCTFDRGGAAPLNVVVSSYPTEVAPDQTFEVLIDVLNIDEALELNVAAPDGISVAETVGPSFAVLEILVGDAEPGVQTVLVELASGERQNTVNLGFRVAQGAEDDG